jgi:hypothetical protein
MSSKGDARIARELAKKLKQQEKSARLVSRLASSPPQDRTVRTRENPDSIYRMKMEWKIDDADRVGGWSWGPREWGQEAWDEIIHPKLSEFSALRWAEIESFTTGGKDRHRMHHSMETDIICMEAQNRLAELGYEPDEIYRFRLGSRRRLWGFRIVQVFETLWYDPLHRIYPTEPH